MPNAEELQRSLGRVEGKIDGILTGLEKHFRDDLDNFATIEARVGKVERKIYWFSGAWAVIGALAYHFIKLP
jgi:hypothetical protein